MDCTSSIPPKLNKRSKGKNKTKQKKEHVHHKVMDLVQGRLVPLVFDKSEAKYGKPMLSLSQRTFMRSMLSDLLPSRVFHIPCGITQGIVSSAGGVINSVFPDSNVTTAPNFISLASVFDEFRVVGVGITIESNNKYSKSTTLSTVIMMVHDSVDSLALTSYNVAADYANACISNLDDWWPHHGMGNAIYYKLSASEAANLWQPVGASTIIGSLKLYANGASASIGYALGFFRYDVEFRLLV